MKNQVIQGDCLIEMQKIPDNSVDLIITDPPYGINLSKGYKKDGDRILGDDGFSVMFFLDDILKEYKRILKPDSAVYIFTRFDVFPYWWLKCKNYFYTKNCITWAKGGGFTGDLNGNYGNNSEMIIYLTNGKHKLREKREGNVWFIPKVKLEYHETQKPVSLLEKIILHSSDEGQVVLDPFAGSGTTGVAARNLKRNFILIEKEPEYVDIINKRLSP